MNTPRPPSAPPLKTAEPISLEALFTEHRRRLLAMIRFRLDHRLAKRFAPEDVLQESYLAAAKRLKHYDPEAWSSPFLWLRAVVNQTVIDLHRRHLGAQKRDAARETGILSLAPAGATSLSVAFRLLGGAPSPSAEVIRDDLLLRVQQAVAEMDDLDREVLALRHFEELTNKEAAEALGIGEKAASMRYVRALKRLKELLRRFSGFLSGDLHV